VTEAPSWISAAIVAVPLVGLAGSAIAFVVRMYLEAAERRRQRFFRMIEYINGQGGIIEKLAAMYQLREFTEHREFLIRLLEMQRGNITGGQKDNLVAEMDRTVLALKGIKESSGSNVPNP
jgi:hypothetical protein